MKYLKIAFLLLPLLGFAQQPERTTPKPMAAAIIVEDIERSSQWYSMVLKLSMDPRTFVDMENVKILNMFNDGFNLELIQLKKAVDPAQAIEGYTNRTRLLGLFKLGYGVEDFDTWVAYLKEIEVEFSGSVVVDPNSKDGKRMVNIKDPDGNRIQFFEL